MWALGGPIISLFTLVILNVIVVRSQFGSLGSISEPISLRGDALFGLRVFTNLERYGSWSGGSYLGWPEGQNLWDYPPVGDLGNIAISYALVTMLGNAVTAYNVFYLLGFNLQYVVTLLGLKALGYRTWVAATCSIAFALAPYHFDRGVGHLYLSNYAVIMLVVCLAIAELRALSSSGSAKPTSAGSKIWYLKWAGAGLVASMFGIYYALFSGVIFVTLMAFLALKGLRSRRVAVGVSTLAAGVLGQVVLVRVRQSGELATPARQLWESDLYSLKPVFLLTPSQWSEIEFFANVRGEVAQAIQFPGEAASSLGIVLSLATLYGISRGLLRFRPVDQNPNAKSLRNGARRNLELGIVILIMAVFMVLSMSGGGGAYLSLLGLEEFRVWARASIVFAALATVLLALLFEELERNFSRLPTLALSSLLLLIGVGMAELALVRGNEALSDQAATDADSARSAAAELERDLSSGSVLQLPLVPFPESPPIEKMTDYSHFLPTLYTDKFAWSYGNIRYRGRTLPCAPPDSELANCAVDKGYKAIWIDRLAYQDGAESLIAQLINEFEALGARTITRTPNERYAYIVIDESYGGS